MLIAEIFAKYVKYIDALTTETLLVDQIASAKINGVQFCVEISYTIFIWHVERC